jgi:hypothetical protein
MWSIKTILQFTFQPIWWFSTFIAKRLLNVRCISYAAVKEVMIEAGK